MFADRTRIVALAAILASTAAGQVALTPLFNTGQPAPGFPQGATITGFISQREMVSINGRGHTCQAAAVGGGGVTMLNDSGLWLVKREGAELLLREGDPAPGVGPDIHFGAINMVSGINADDSAFALVQLVGAGVISTNDSAIYRCARGSAPVLVIREGDSAPGLPPEDRMSNPRGLTLYSENQVAWYALVGGVTHTWATSADGVVHLFGQGDPISNLPGATLTNASAPMCLDGLGTLGFSAGIVGGPPGGALGLFTYSPASGITLLARIGAEAEGIDGDAVYSSFGGVGIGELRGAFTAMITGPGITGANNQACYRVLGESLENAWREGDAAPGMGPGVVYSTLQSFTPTVDAMYVSCLIAGGDVDTNNDMSIWRVDGTPAELVAREAQPAPGLPQDVVFSAFSFFASDSGLLASPAGRLLFPAALRGPLVNPANDRAVFMTDPIGQIHPVLRRGDNVQTTHGQPQTVANFTRGAFNRRSEAMLIIQYNNSGQGIYMLKVECPQTGCQAVDLDGDCRVDLADMSLLLAEFGATGPEHTADTDRDDDVDLQDLANVLSAFGNDCTGG
jgi:hypothetical protein